MNPPHSLCNLTMVATNCPREENIFMAKQLEPYKEMIECKSSLRKKWLNSWRKFPPSSTAKNFLSKEKPSHRCLQKRHRCSPYFIRRRGVYCHRCSPFWVFFSVHFQSWNLINLPLRFVCVFLASLLFFCCVLIFRKWFGFAFNFSLCFWVLQRPVMGMWFIYEED